MLSFEIFHPEIGVKTFAAIGGDPVSRMAIARGPLHGVDDDQFNFGVEIEETQRWEYFGQVWVA